MSLAHAIAQTMQAHGLKTAEIAALLGMAQDRTTFYRMLNGATTEPRLVTFVQLCIALETTPSELLELAGVWSPDTPGHAGPDDLRLRQAFGQIGELPMDGKSGWSHLSPRWRRLWATRVSRARMMTQDVNPLPPAGCERSSR